MFAKLDNNVSVAPQIGPGDVLLAREQGYSLIVNNRPDGEEPGQPSSAAIEAAAVAAGLDYLHIPVAGGLSMDMIDRTERALAGATGRVLMFCRSGTRSALLWGLAAARAGRDPQELSELAAAAGYDLSPIDGAMRALSGR
jgi:uncharacterized protein (TIGR01244 family)